jgi:hypothetical protein
MIMIMVIMVPYSCPCHSFSYAGYNDGLNATKTMEEVIPALSSKAAKKENVEQMPTIDEVRETEKREV